MDFGKIGLGGKLRTPQRGARVLYTVLSRKKDTHKRECLSSHFNYTTGWVYHVVPKCPNFQVGTEKCPIADA